LCINELWNVPFCASVEFLNQVFSAFLLHSLTEIVLLLNHLTGKVQKTDRYTCKNCIWQVGKAKQTNGISTEWTEPEKN